MDGYSLFISLYYNLFMEKLNNIYKYISKITYLVFLYGIGIFLPIYYNNYYFDIMDAKAQAYQYLYTILFPLLIITFILQIITKKISFKKPLLLISLICLLVSCGISTYTSFAPQYAFDGSQGWFVGFYVIGTLLFTILVLKDVKIENRKFFIPVYITCFLVFAMVILDTMEIDLLGMNENLKRSSLHNYLTTLGNTNWIVGYLSLLIPYFICTYINEKQKAYRVLFLLICVVLLFTFVVLNCDGIILGLGFCVLFLIPFIFDDLDNVKKFSIFPALLALLILSIKHLSIFKIYGRLTDGLFQYIYNPIVVILLFVISIVLYVLSTSYREKEYRKFKNKIIYSLIGLIIIGILALSYYVLNIYPIDFSNGRLLIWKTSFERFKEFNVHMKVFGTGPELLRNIYSYLSMMDNAIYNSSHSEAIQMLLTTGIVGLICWLMNYVSIFYYYLKEKDNRNIGLYIGIFAYFAQSFVNSATIPNLAILSLFIIEIFKD